MVRPGHHSREQLCRSTAIAVLAALVLVAGCRRQMAVHPVGGRVTLDGKPLLDASISFRPERGPEAVATLDADGRYRLSTRAAGDGAVAGAHAVTLALVTEGLALDPGKPPRLEKPSPGAVPVPERYLRAETSGLRATVVPGTNTFDFDLTTK